MAQRFNAPPGWNVPPDFVPSADWQPDPSWPPAPEGWNFWVDDAAAPAYGTPPAGQASPPAAYGSVPVGAPPGAPSGYATPAGAYGSTAPGSAQGAIAVAQQANARKSMLIGVGLTVVAIAIWVISYSMAGPGDRYFAPWYLALAGIILAIRGLVEYNKAKKAVAAAQGFGSVSNPQGITPPGQNPPGTF